MASKKKIKQINLIPLINIIFLMLIFFMLAGTITTIDPYKIKVPESIIKNDPLTPFLTIIPFLELFSFPLEAVGANLIFEIGCPELLGLTLIFTTGYLE